MAASSKILLVEPHAGALAALARRLSEAGHSVTCCPNGAIALAELRRAPHELILAELRNAPMSGLDLLRSVRADTSLADLPVILIAGRSDKAGAVEGFAAGADDVVAKPFDSDVLLARIAHRLGQARALKELRRDKATLDARVVSRAIELGEMRSAWRKSEAERQRLARVASIGPVGA